MWRRWQSFTQWEGGNEKKRKRECVGLCPEGKEMGKGKWEKIRRVARSGDEMKEMGGMGNHDWVWMVRVE